MEHMEQGTGTVQENDAGQKKENRQESAAGQTASAKQETAYRQMRRVGSVTFGVTLICYGMLFLIHTFVPTLGYRTIFKCWPVIFILLGIEILVENYKCRTQEWKMMYDFPAVIMLGAMLLFAMVMAAFDYAMVYETVCF